MLFGRLLMEHVWKLLNSSVARSLNPEDMANAMRLAVISGRLGYKSGFIEKSKLALTSTTFKGKISNFWY